MSTFTAVLLSNCYFVLPIFVFFILLLQYMYLITSVNVDSD